MMENDKEFEYIKKIIDLSNDNLKSHIISESEKTNTKIDNTNTKIDDLHEIVNRIIENDTKQDKSINKLNIESISKKDSKKNNITTLGIMVSVTAILSFVIKTFGGS